ncbi:MAG TPA: polysaccharide deacetylase family protein [Firmicutes bacterium]|nr:polysaccharide deacetylase family protein [Bacillota bacterium]
MIKKRNPLSYALTGLVCLLMCGGIIAVWAGAPASASVSADPRAVYSGSSETSVALMFNVYSGEEYIPSIIDTLKSEGASATFFIGGCWAEKNADTLRSISDGGFETGSHGYLHRDHSALGYDANLEEMRVADRLISDITGAPVKLFAPPSGAYSSDTLDAAEHMGYVTVLWSKDTIDWRDHDATLITERAVKNVKGGDFILMHPTKETAEALPAVIAGIKAAGLVPSCVSDAL